MQVDSPCVIDGEFCDTFNKYPERCAVCYNKSYFLAKKVKNKPAFRQAKKSRRMGATFEEENHASNIKMLKASSSMTPNSGAGKIKGDEQISGIINIMEELKTKVVPKYSRGSLTFTIQKEWLDKLTKEARDENKEFWYLKFRFLENDKETYIIVDEEIIASMIKTMVSDRRKAYNCDLEVDVCNKKVRAIETELVAAKSKIAYLEAQLEYFKKINSDNQ